MVRTSLKCALAGSTMLASTILVGAAPALARKVEESGWDSSVLESVAKAASESLAPRHDEMTLANEGIDRMMQWKAIHPRFNRVVDREY